MSENKNRDAAKYIADHIAVDEVAARTIEEQIYTALQIAQKRGEVLARRRIAELEAENKRLRKALREISLETATHEGDATYNQSYKAPTTGAQIARAALATDKRELLDQSNDMILKHGRLTAESERLYAKATDKGEG